MSDTTAGDQCIYQYDPALGVWILVQDCTTGTCPPPPPPPSASSATAIDLEASGPLRLALQADGAVAIESGDRRLALVSVASGGRQVIFDCVASATAGAVATAASTA